MTLDDPQGMPILRRYSAFSETPAGGNPAGVWLGESLPAPARMLQIATDLGYSETVFLTPAGGSRYTTRYFSPQAEVSFCGHASIAAGVMLGERHGPDHYVLDTSVGPVPVDVRRQGGRLHAALTSVEPRQTPPSGDLLEGALKCLGWRRRHLDRGIPPMLAWAGAWHLVLAVRERATLDALDYDYPALEQLMREAGLTTLQLIWRAGSGEVHARNPFPVGGVVEDPATGAAAAALGGYLRDAGLLSAPARFLIHQGIAMGRPSLIEVEVPVAGGITVSGTAVALDPPTPAGRSAEELAHAFMSRVWRAPADLDAIDELMSEDYIIHSAGVTLRGRERFKDWVSQFQTLLQDAGNEVLDLFADAGGERVVARWLCSGINRGIFGLPADGRPIRFSGIAIWRVANNRLAECWVERSALEAVRDHQQDQPAG